MPLRVLTYTNLFPNHIRPNFGIFIKNRMQPLVRKRHAILDVVAPVPYFPKLPWRTRWVAFSRIKTKETQGEISVYHPRYIVVPKIGMRTHGQSMYWATSRLVSRLHRQEPYDLMDAHWIYPDGYAAVKIAREINIPVILSARGNDINEYIDFQDTRPLITWCLKNCDHVISVCQALKDLMLSLGIPESKITVIGNGVDLAEFHPVPREEARRQLGLPMNRRIIVSVGILEPRKGHHVLIEAVRKLKDENRDPPHLLIIGGGSFSDRLRTQILKLGLEHDVSLVGEVPHRELRTWYSAADVCCLASDREGWPNVLLESIACGTPVVASRVYGVAEVVTSRDLGLLVEERTPEAFAAQIRCALMRTWEAKRMVAFAQGHSWDEKGEAVKQVFLKVLGSAAELSSHRIG